jgi:hypothetical protein
VPISALFVLSGCGVIITGGTTVTPVDEGVPNIVLTEVTLDLGVADNVGELLSKQLIIQNTGTGDLEITEILIAEPFVAALTALTVNAGSSASLGVFLTPTEYGESTATLSITSDDPDEPYVEVVINGRVLVDVDEDGFDRPEAGGDDCDDQDASVNPDAEEVWYDGIDQDCDGANDYDQDGDGYETDVFNESVANGGGDCNDVVAYIYPGADDIWYDGVDGDCAGDNDYDADGDGYGIKLLDKGNDCDDDDAEAYPGSVERLNGKLDNCDGSRDREIPPYSADYEWFGDTDTNGVGYATTAGDIDGDGIDDLVVGAPWYDGYTSGASDPSGDGAIYLWLSDDWIPGTGEDVGEAYNNIRGGNSELLGSAVMMLDDFDGAGGVDLALGAPGMSGNTGMVYVIDALELESYGDTGDSHTTIEGSSSYGYRLGSGMADVGDLNGDGYSELLMAYNSSSSADSGSVRLALHYGDAAASGTVNMSLGDVDARFETDRSTNKAKFDLSASGDLNNDGYLDWSHGNNKDSYFGSGTGAVWVLWGRSSPYGATGGDFRDGAGTTAGAYGVESIGVGAVSAILPDMDGDGFDELAYWSQGTAEISVVSGELAAAAPTTVDDAFLTLTFDGDWVATGIRSIGDWDGDGVAEWSVGIDGDSSYGGGTLLIYRGADLTGTHDGEQAAAAEIYGDSDYGYGDFSFSVMGTPADLDGDGDLDLITGDPWMAVDLDGDGEGEDAVGSVHIFLNHGL